VSATTDLVDALVAVVPIPTGAVRDTSCAEPIKYEADRVYGWPMPETFVEESPEMDRDNFTVAIAVTASSTEDSTQVPDRTVSLALGAAADAITDWVRGNRQDHAHTPQLWDDLQARVMWPGLRGFGWRGVRVELSGYRFVS
jgi:hypothetical protein